jgi:hypothetical protein
MFVVVASVPPSSMSSAAYHKDRSSDRCYSPFILHCRFDWKLSDNTGFRSSHQYTDDSQIVHSCLAVDASSLSSKFSIYIDCVLNAGCNPIDFI